MSRDFKYFCFGFGINHITTSTYYHKPKHSARFNHNFKIALIAYHDASWDEQSIWLQCVFNTVRHESHPKVPFLFFFGSVPNMSLSLHWHISELLPDAHHMADIPSIWGQAHRQLLRSHRRGMGTAATNDQWRLV